MLVKLTNREIIIVDDIASTGKTLEQAVIQLQKPTSISIIATHVFLLLKHHRVSKV